MGNNEKKTFVLTKEVVASAKTYMPINVKYDFAASLVDGCLIAAKPDEQEKSMSLSPFYKEDNRAKAVLVQNIFFEYYFGAEVPTERPLEFYDECGQAALMNTLERYKSDAALKDKIYDILADYKEFKKIVDAEIYQEKQHRNDPISRLLANMAKTVSPNTFAEKGEELKKLLKGLEDGREELKEKREKELNK